MRIRKQSFCGVAEKIIQKGIQLANMTWGKNGLFYLVCAEEDKELRFGPTLCDSFPIMYP